MAVTLFRFVPMRFLAADYAEYADLTLIFYLISASKSAYSAYLAAKKKYVKFSKNQH
jgi:hypothetical protein